MFPFKQQILENVKKSLPQVVETQSYSLDQSEYGLINLENKSAYLPKPKENLIKKYVTNLEKLLDNSKIAIELLEIRNPSVCIDETFRKQCKEKGIRIISILTKIDTIKDISAIEAKTQPLCETLLKFTVDHKQKSTCLDAILQVLRESNIEGNIFVAGKALTGKHSFITNIAKHIGKYNATSCELNLIKISDTLRLIDSPYKLEDTTGYPLFKLPNPILEESLFSQEEQLVKSLFLEKDLFNRSDILEHFGIQDFTSLTDLLSKVGKAWKVFGKGGNVDATRVRGRILSEWFNGKLSHFLQH